MDPFDPPSTPTGPMGCASGDRLSPLRRFGAIYGVLNASRELSFDICHHSLHQTTFSSSLMSSRNWLSRGCPRGEGRAPGRRASPFHCLRAIYGVLNASCGLSFDICHQPLNQTTLRSSLVSSRDCPPRSFPSPPHNGPDRAETRGGCISLVSRMCVLCPRACMSL